MNDKKYMILFHDPLTNPHIEKGTVRVVAHDEMFRWVERAHKDGLKISIYVATQVCDLT